MECFPPCQETRTSQSSVTALQADSLLKTKQLLRVKQITGPCWMLETSAQGWCTGKTQRDGMEREVGGGRLGWGTHVNPMADSCECMAKTATIL